MIKKHNHKSVAFAILGAISTFLLLSPIDFLTGIQIDDLGYLFSSIVMTVLQIENLFSNNQKKDMEVDYQ